MNIRLAALGVVSALAFSTAAYADDSRLGDDEVTLKNGGTVRGTVTTVQPGKAVQIVEGGSQEIRVFPWSQVADVQKAKYATASKPAPAKAEKDSSEPAQPPKAEDAPAAKTDTDGVRVHIDSPVPATLFRQRTHVSRVGVVAPVYGYYGYGAAYVGEATVASVSEEAVCSSPCDRVVDAEGGDQFLIRGEFPTTKKFTLAGQGDHPNVTLDPGSNGKRIGGIVMMSGGGASMAGGIIALFIGAMGTTEIDPRGNVTTGQNTPALAAGGTMLGAGAALLGGGIALAVTSASHVDVGPGGADRASTAFTLAPWVGAPTNASSKSDTVFGVRGAF